MANLSTLIPSFLKVTSAYGNANAAHDKANTATTDAANARAHANSAYATANSAQTQGDVLDDLNILGAAASDGQFIVATGAGAFAYESGDTARISLGVGTTDFPTFKNVTDTRFAVTGTTPAIDPANGGIQTWTLTGVSTPTDAFGDGESIILEIDDGSAYTVTWTSLVDEWIGGAAPTLDTTNTTVIALWKTNATVIGKLIGVAS